MDFALNCNMDKWTNLHFPGTLRYIIFISFVEPVWLFNGWIVLQIFWVYKWVYAQSNKPKKVSECKEKQSKLDKYLCFAI
jgi:hypothetical protein